MTDINSIDHWNNILEKNPGEYTDENGNSHTLNYGIIDDKEGFETGGGNYDSLCDGDCNTCMTTPIDQYKTKLGAILCCKSHPETGEINEETSACPEYNMDTGKCNIYNTENYPIACKNYHCKTHNR